ncbi:hypothetical protein LIPSTDRAFT_68483 [Lipomyces starkeyi NRRL Y-11557]|uniref:Uncharacterized protein n=1 Tax=Lipomyces starkeyi NRRL Y-11557 TaxID=675824 RepID=A0A1E3QDR5_LIPST|nr:hypothetical protein LIPSTDRAFT_68483 [Lipomyces starkeyi NRRL Y-11557]
MSWLRRSVNLYRPPTPKSCALSSPSRMQRGTHPTDTGNWQPSQGSAQKPDEINDASNNRVVPCLDLARWAYSRHCEDYFHMPHATSPLPAPRAATSQSPIIPATQIGFYNLGRDLVRDVILHMGTRPMALLITVVLDLGILFGAWRLVRQYVTYTEDIGWAKWAEWACWMGVYLFGCAIGFVYAARREVGLDGENSCTSGRA